MKRARNYQPLVCPDGHGALLEMTDGELRCIAQAHDGRPKGHPDGPSAATRSRFTVAELLPKAWKG